ncbi:flagellar basal body-associated protein FliL [Piscinibacter sp.]|jgi:flagellar FliL protein|uniref:flagellar basal body-associated FliL family protein n=1 Tax=Piscinibacter sp. TaxID=1903157 RepID=UPI00355964B7
MSAAAAEPVEDGEAPPPAPAPKTGRKKLIILVAAALLVVTAAGGAATYVIKKRAAAAEEAGDDAAAGSHAAPARDVHKNPPSFLPLEPFIVNLADRDTDRYAQVGITLELDDPHSADELKAYMPAIRNGILMVLAHKTSKQLLGRAGKEALAAEIMREAVRPLGLDLDDPVADPLADATLAVRSEDDEDEDAPAPAAKHRKQAADQNPVRHVHFSSFIIQ